MPRANDNAIVHSDDLLFCDQTVRLSVCLVVVGWDHHGEYTASSDFVVNVVQLTPTYWTGTHSNQDKERCCIVARGRILRKEVPRAKNDVPKTSRVLGNQKSPREDFFNFRIRIAQNSTPSAYPGWGHRVVLTPGFDIRIVFETDTYEVTDEYQKADIKCA